MTPTRRPFLKALAALGLAASLPARADEVLDAARSRGRLRIALYDKFPPYSEGEKGIDAELGQALAARLGLTPQFIPFKADDDMADDLRNMVWKGHYLRGEPADVMLHVPVDRILADANDKVRIFGAYHLETIALAREPSRVPAPGGSAAVSLEVFTREKIGVEGSTLADSFLLGVLRGRLRDNVVHFRSVREAVAALKDGQLAAVLAPRGELDAALGSAPGIVVEDARYPELSIKQWPVGMAVKADAPDLQAALTHALAELQADGTVAAIFKKHGVRQVNP